MIGNHWVEVALPIDFKLIFNRLRVPPFHLPKTLTRLPDQ
jgi:hypothetical protein